MWKTNQFANNHFLDFLVVLLLIWRLLVLFLIMTYHPALHEIRHPQKHAPSHLQLLIVIIWQECGWTWVGCIIWIALGVNQTHPHLLPQKLQPLDGPHCLTLAVCQNRGGASVLHLVTPAAQALLLWHVWSVCVCVCLEAESGVCCFMIYHSIRVLSHSLSLSVPTVTPQLHKAVVEQ